MKRSLLLWMIFPAVGCMGLKPVGPITQGMFDTPANANKPGHAIITSPRDIPTMPILAEGPKPPAPTFVVDPVDVNAGNARNSAMKLQQELETDFRNADLIPNYTEVSRVKRK